MSEWYELDLIDIELDCSRKTGVHGWSRTFLIDLIYCKRYPFMKMTADMHDGMPW